LSNQGIDMQTKYIVKDKFWVVCFNCKQCYPKEKGETIDPEKDVVRTTWAYLRCPKCGGTNTLNVDQEHERYIRSFPFACMESGLRFVKKE
jgi:Zn finger protein HypA/HybF involved in hydrogenase expression